MTRRFRIAHRDDEWTADVAAEGAVTIGDRRFHVAPAGDGRVRVVDELGHATIVSIAGAGAVLWAGADGSAYPVSVDGNPTRGRTARPAGGGDLSAPMPASVVKVAVAIGDRVAAGDPVVVLEAMKMELTVRAPRDGVVTAIACRQGELVAPGRPLVELGP